MKEKEFNIVVEQTSQRIYRFVFKNLKSDADTKDVVQETYIKFWTKKDDLEKEKVTAWLFTTAYRTMIDFIRKRKPQFNIDEEVVAEYTDTRVDTTNMVHQYLDLLSPVFKSTILLRDIEGYNYAEIGNILNLSESQVKVYLFRARKKLKSIIELNEI
ncbi:RNA polymerase sigma factor [uncultured Cytophaga sp.]|uniref:RNA polymerase sigma factor n=1 Tax=uncultured Cytophaga sp. TaxID=160238 RepID=UPI002605232F|nr:RNA polymerase sigma factor [uncultured Cytophaga sp.]